MGAVGNKISPLRALKVKHKIRWSRYTHLQILSRQNGLTKWSQRECSVASTSGRSVAVESAQGTVSLAACVVAFCGSMKHGARISHETWDPLKAHARWMKRISRQATGGFGQPTTGSTGQAQARQEQQSYSYCPKWAAICDGFDFGRCCCCCRDNLISL